MKRGDILYGKGLPAQVLREYGDLCLQEGKPNDAVEFFCQACYKQRLRSICRCAVEEGDLFLFFPAAESLLEQGYPEDGKKPGKRALEKGGHSAQRRSAREGISMRQGQGLARLYMIRRRQRDVESR
ncbi:MAG: hypothetical protein A2Z08_07030 [Deltaproteobacteria bacterium RBG_16_54_11]|jgi:hypothetical protein|nr:MAG: hypothetical protein A2Z08_07030 [Deltaproteobacteria bacterium RBG_16_54_11]